MKDRAQWPKGTTNEDRLIGIKMFIPIFSTSPLGPGSSDEIAIGNQNVLELEFLSQLYYYLSQTNLNDNYVMLFEILS